MIGGILVVNRIERVLGNIDQVTMSHSSDREDAGRIDTSDSDGGTLYRLPTSSEHSDESDEHRDRVESSDEVRSRETKRRNRLANDGYVERTEMKGPNSLHTNEGVPGDSSDRPPYRERLSRTQRSEKPKEKTVIADVHNTIQSNLSPSFDGCSSGGRQHYCGLNSSGPPTFL